MIYLHSYFHSEPRGLVIRHSASFSSNNNFSSSDPAVDAGEEKEKEETRRYPPLGSSEDLDCVSRQPLKRAKFALELVLEECEEKGSGTTTDMQQAARLALAYVALVRRDYERAMELAQAVMSSSSIAEPSDTSSSTSGGGITTSLTLSESLRARRSATARMYAAEASCCLGDAAQAMKYLAHNDLSPTTSTPSGQPTAVTGLPNEGNGNHNNTLLDRLASNLAGVTIETAAVSGMAKRRLARAQVLVRASACIVTATLGGNHNMIAAKQLAMQAQAMEDASSSSSAFHHYQSGAPAPPALLSSSSSGSSAIATSSASAYPNINGNAGAGNGEFVNRSLARRALIYCLLRGGNSSAALSLLQSMRHR